ncbi:hypothetical protein ACO0LV_07225 [Pseudactinotalea sp. Z1739]|uniref:hypothetical protein n=1 Tax=Pseudactinotalea sp. Z1739 TaxID=3413028 RepID=UPI003C7D3D11
MSPRPHASRAFVVVGPAGDFDMADFINNPRPITLAAGGQAALAQADLPAGVLQALELIRDVEQAALDWLRDLLITPTHADAEVTAFLTTWAYEKYWLADLLGRVLADHPPPEAPGPGLRARLAEQAHERLFPTLAAIGTNLQGPRVIAGQLATGLADTFALRVMTIRLAELVPALDDLTRSVLHSTERHVAFYTEQIHRRAGTNAPARRSLHRALRGWRWPGSRYAEPRRIGAILRYVLGHPEARPLLAQADTALSALPGGPRRAVLRTEFARFVVHGTNRWQLRVQ